MSDLLIGEMLSIILLLPVLLRPFFRRLQRLGGIPILPLLSFLACCAIFAGSGFRMSLLPVFLFTLLVFVSGLSRLFRLFRGLPTDLFTVISEVWHGFLLIVFVLTVAVSWKTRPELSRLPQGEVRTSTFTVKVSAGVTGRYTVWEPVLKSGDGSAGRNVVLLGANRTTLAWILAEQGWTVVKASYWTTGEYRNAFLSVPFFRDACVLCGTVFTGKPFLTDENERTDIITRNLARLVRFARDEYGQSVPLYAIAEGESLAPLVRYLKADPASLAGAVCIVPEAEGSDFIIDASLPVIHTVVSGMMDSGAGSYPVLALSGDNAYLYGLGELCADDVLASRFLGGTRDAGRKQAELAGRRVATWLEMRRKFHDIK